MQTLRHWTLTRLSVQWLQGGEARLSLLLLGAWDWTLVPPMQLQGLLVLGGSVVAGCDLAHEGPRV